MILTLTACFLTLLVLRSSAQFSKGTIMPGTTVGSTGYSSANSNYDYESGEIRSAGTNNRFRNHSLSNKFHIGYLIVSEFPAIKIRGSTYHAGLKMKKG